MEEPKLKNTVGNDLKPVLRYSTDATIRHSAAATKRVHKHFKGNPKNLIILLTAILIIFLAYGYWHAKNELNRLSNPQLVSQDKAKEIINKVKNTVALPEGEQPLLINVNDAKKAQSQGSLFTLAQNGDKVLYYQKSGYVLLYRPSTGKVIEFSKTNSSNQ